MAAVTVMWIHGSNGAIQSLYIVSWACKVFKDVSERLGVK